MALITALKDGRGSNSRALVGPDGELSTVCHPRPPTGNYCAGAPFRAYLSTAAGSSNMAIDGSSAPEEFFIESDPDLDIYIKSVSILIADPGADLNRFGNIVALNNGVVFKYISPDMGETTFHEGLKTSFDVLRLATLHTGTGSNTSALRLNNAVGNAEAYIAFIDFNTLCGFQWGIRLKAGAKERLSFIVQDDITGLSAFNVIAYGAKF